MTITNSKNSDITTNIGSWLTRHGLKILIIIIVIILLLGLAKAFFKLLGGGLDSIGKGIEDVAGAAANFVNSTVKECSSQDDCSTSNDSTSCAKLNGCNWLGPTTSDVSGSCLNITGRATGQGSFFSSDCMIGMGLIIGVSSLAFIKLLGFFINKYKNKNIEKAAAAGDKSGDEVFTDTVSTAEKLSRKLLEDDKTPRTEESKRDVAARVTNEVSAKKAKAAISKNDEDPAQAKKQIEEVEASRVTVQEGIDEKASDNNLPADEIGKNQEDSKNIVDQYYD